MISVGFRETILFALKYESVKFQFDREKSFYDFKIFSYINRKFMRVNELSLEDLSNFLS